MQGGLQQAGGRGPGPAHPFWSYEPAPLLRLALACLAVLAALKLGSEFYRLMFDAGPKGAIDLAMRHAEVQRWFAGSQVYGELANATYPPASMVMMWPFAGWASFGLVRWLWACLSALWLAWMIVFLIRECAATRPAERGMIALVVLSMNATGIAVGNGQFAIPVMLLLIAMLSLVRAGAGRSAKDYVIALLMLLALVKPSVSAPFFLALLLVFPRPGPALVCLAAYALLTLLAAAFQRQDAITLVFDWFTGATAINAQAAAAGVDYGSVHGWLALAGFDQWHTPVSLLLLCALAAWLYRFRSVDPWLVFGVTAMAARAWTYHGLYDDMLILLPLFAVYRHAKAAAREGNFSPCAPWLLSGSVFVMLLPARLYNAWGAPWPALYALSHLFFWALLLLYLLRAAAGQRRGLQPGAIQ